MSLLEHFKVFLHLFHFNALVPFRFGSDDIKFRNWKCVSIVKAIIFSITNVAITAYLFSDGYVTAYGKITTILNAASLVTQLLINLAAYIQCCYNSSNYELLSFGIKDVERTFNEKFSRILPISSLANQYRLKFIFISILSFTEYIVFIYGGWTMSEISGAMSVVCCAILNSISVLVTMHAVLYVDIAQMFLRELNLRIQNSPICFYSSTKIEFLKTVKSLHMDLRKIVTQINVYFSWSLLFITINSMINFVYDSYSFFLTLDDKWDILSISASAVGLLAHGGLFFILVNSSHLCSSEAENLIENIEEYAFWTNEDARLYKVKCEILSQMKAFPLIISANGFFEINRAGLACFTGTCCTYIIIFIQFFLSEEKK